jgi:hypothetical protein
LKIAHQDNRSLAICLGTFLALIWLLFISNVLSVDALYYGGISSTLVLLFMALRGYFPFDREGHIRSGVFWAVLVMLASLPLSTMIKSRVILFWYPTTLICGLFCRMQSLVRHFGGRNWRCIREMTNRHSDAGAVNKAHTNCHPRADPLIYDAAERVRPRASLTAMSICMRWPIDPRDKREDDRLR